MSEVEVDLESANEPHADFSLPGEKKIRHVYESRPKAPEHLWDIPDAQFLDMVRCSAFVQVSSIDPKKGTFRLRMKCLWSFRTLNSNEEAEVVLRGVPGIRIPRLGVTVEESRVWKDMSFRGPKHTTTDTIYWKGTSLLTMEGFKFFNMLEFPFDRHVLDLGQIEFVWRSDKDAADYYKSMNVVHFTIQTSSLMPEWKSRTPYIQALNETSSLVGNTSGHSVKPPTYATKFHLRLPIERKHHFYIWQVFLVTYLITILSVSGVFMPPMVEYLNTRFELFIGGVLTLVAFKYGIADHLPSVPYQTFADWFMLLAILTVVVCALVTLYPFRFVHDTDDPRREHLDRAENAVGGLVCLLWTGAIFWAAFVKPRRRTPWKEVTKRDVPDSFGEEVYDSPDSDDTRSWDEGGAAQSKATLTTPTLPDGPPSSWDVAQVARFISSLEMPDCVRRFREDGVDGKMLTGLSQKELQQDLGLTRLQAKKVSQRLHDCIKEAKGHSRGAVSAGAGARGSEIDLVFHEP